MFTFDLELLCKCNGSFPNVKISEVSHFLAVGGWQLAFGSWQLAFGQDANS